jgi:putative molybdopterin biosynthesis protein
VFRRLLSLDKAREVVKRSFSPKPIGVEKLAISEGHGRVLAEDVVAPIDVPSFNRSTVDGYAVKAADTFGAEEDRPVEFKLCGHIAIGETPSVIVKERMTAEIVTGAPLPSGADAIVMLEYAIRENNTVSIHRPVAKGENVMKAGSDIQKDETILRRGQRVSSREIGVLAANQFVQLG